MGKGPFFTAEDAKSAFNLFCCIYGVGTLGMPGNFSRAGPYLAVIAMAFMAFANVYASITMSKVMLLAPKSVKTFGDLGEWCMGKTGRWLCVISQMGSCLLIPCVFLVLGGSLLDGLFPKAFSQTTWIILMACMVLPVCLVPTLKEGAGAAFAGCLGTIIADILGVAVVMHGMSGHPSVPSPDLSFSQVAGCFGNLSLAYGAGIVIPDIQRQHSDPKRMPRVVGVTVGVISILFLVLASTAYSAVGCQISGNLLFTIYPHSETGLTNLGFAPNWGTIVLAYLFMQLHITIAFAVLINPAFYIAERVFLGMHQQVEEDLENANSYLQSSTPADLAVKESVRSSKMSYVSVADGENMHKDNLEEEAAEYRGVNAIKYVVMRIAIVIVLVIISIVLKDDFTSLADFVGASCITVNCILLPIVFYLKKSWGTVKMWEKVAGSIVVVICFVLGCYVTYTTGKELFAPSDDEVEFPYCAPERTGGSIRLNARKDLKNPSISWDSRRFLGPSKMPFFTLEDAKTSFNLFCCMYGIGTLGMPGNFSRAGPAIAVIAMLFMAFANIYASVKMSQVMLLAPKSVKTFGDLGEWSMGKWGRWLSVVSQMGSCLLIPCVFLVLGGSLLDGLFSEAFSQTTWIILMALMVLPVCLIPTLKEGAGAAFAGCMGTIIADVIGVAVVMHGMRGHPTVPSPDLKFSQVVGCFGNLALAYGAGIVIPDLQRQHSDPTRMPRVVLVTVTFISCLFLTLASTAYSAVGCQISGNLLYTIYPDSETGMTTLGFKPSWGAVVLAYLFMQLHITIAFSVIVNPAFFIAERLALGMHKKQATDIEAGLNYTESLTPAEVQSEPRRSSKMSYVSVADSEREFKDDAEAEAAEYRGGSNTVKYVVLRVVIVIILVVLAVIFQDHFSDFADFVGASCITTNCILLPIIYYLIKAWTRVPMYEKVAATIVVVICFILGCYVTYTTGKALFAPTDDDTEFPYCDSKYENQVYYNYTAEHES
ncbi:hypothetical protein BBO99_00008867 [Phytophthora kernoviae]|uniref:Amino acid transporter transmembrane domain-containing protein n=2 Tax=Phytophthora kernoviae TaxID=325452 RepID=A0A3R7JD24_9STRA|nr:hypothetical protein G195_010644 [Phytophthora kernoviae 00238/432]KAG2508198.1 hypothetical protein JM16_008892 [Phytophthora kernoviae]KAG2510680.1 hypothetical protein JM18_008856 [Phytophthora kernoviae]RLN37436.1 hypothetical protein BBI17_008950 [Phytophthora kernoviae]RLN74580.1 hypothetical protein BBO99_00008867 [Phytophthora kernoviae]